MGLHAKLSDVRQADAFAHLLAATLGAAFPPHFYMGLAASPPTRGPLEALWAADPLLQPPASELGTNRWLWHLLVNAPAESGSLAAAALSPLPQVVPRLLDFFRANDDTSAPLPPLAKPGAHGGPGKAKEAGRAWADESSTSAQLPRAGGRRASAGGRRCGAGPDACGGAVRLMRRRQRRHGGGGGAPPL